MWFELRTEDVGPMPWPKATLDIVYGRTEGECYYCGCRLARDLVGCGDQASATPGAWQVDHWVPRQHCSSDAECEALPNLVPACLGCLGDKGGLTGDEYLEKRKR